MPSRLTFIQAPLCFSSCFLLEGYVCKRVNFFFFILSTFLLHFLTPWSSSKTKQSTDLSLPECQDQPHLIAFSLFFVCLHPSFVSGLIFRLGVFWDRSCLFFDPCLVLSVKVVQINNSKDVLLRCIRMWYCCSESVDAVSTARHCVLLLNSHGIDEVSYQFTSLRSLFWVRESLVLNTLWR